MLFVGLNNPGKEYERTRHNVGEFVLRNLFPEVCDQYDKYLDARIGNGEWRGEKVKIVFPNTYMNLSGDSVKKIIERYAISNQNLVVFHDDIDLPIGTFKISKARGAGGQNGVRSIHASLGTNDYYRVRIGIAHPEFFSKEGSRRSMKDSVHSYVLGTFSNEELETIKNIIPDIEKELVKRLI